MINKKNINNKCTTNLRFKIKTKNKKYPQKINTKKQDPKNVKKLNLDSTIYYKLVKFS